VHPANEPTCVLCKQEIVNKGDDEGVIVKNARKSANDPNLISHLTKMNLCYSLPYYDNKNISLETNVLIYTVLSGYCC